MWDNAVITNVGKATLDAWMEGKVFRFTGAAGGTGRAEAVSLMGQTALVKQMQTLSIVDYEALSGGIKLHLQFEAPDAGYICNQIGVWGSVEGSTPALVALYQDDAGVRIPSKADTPDFIYSFYATIATANAGDFTVNIDSGAAVTVATLEKSLEGLQTATDRLSEGTAIADADQVPVYGAGAGHRRLAWSAIKAAIKGYCDTLYNKYVHPSHPARAKGIYKVTVDNQGHVTGAEAVAKADITALGIPGQDTTYGPAGAALGLIKSGGDLTIVEGVATIQDDSHNHVISNVDGLQTALDSKVAVALKGAAGGLAELDSGGKVPSAQLPSYVDDALEYASVSAFPVPGEAGKIYVALDSNLTYRWSGTAYVEISPSLALGETSATAYRGDRGKIAYDHSQSAKSVSPGAYRRVTVDGQGHVTAGDNSTLPVTEGGTGGATADSARTNLGAAAKPVIKTATLTAAGWSGSAAPYTQTLSVDGVPADQAAVVMVGYPPSATKEQMEAWAAGMVLGTAHAAGSITFQAKGDKPAISLPVQIVIQG